MSRRGKNKEKLDPSQLTTTSDSETQFVSQPDDAETLWEVLEITAERLGEYRVRWAGVDPDGKPWKQDWVPKRDCTPDIVAEWKRKKRQGQLTKVTGVAVQPKIGAKSATSKTTRQPARTSATPSVTSTNATAGPSRKKRKRSSVTPVTSHNDDQDGRSLDSDDERPVVKPKKKKLRVEGNEPKSTTGKAVTFESPHSPEATSKAKGKRKSSPSFLSDPELGDDDFPPIKVGKSGINGNGIPIGPPSRKKGPAQERKPKHKVISLKSTATSDGDEDYYDEIPPLERQRPAPSSPVSPRTAASPVLSDNARRRLDEFDALMLPLEDGPFSSIDNPRPTSESIGIHNTSRSPSPVIRAAPPRSPLPLKLPLFIPNPDSPPPSPLVREMNVSPTKKSPPQQRPSNSSSSCHLTPPPEGDRSEIIPATETQSSSDHSQPQPQLQEDSQHPSAPSQVAASSQLPQTPSRSTLKSRMKPKSPHVSALLDSSAPDTFSPPLGMILQVAAGVGGSNSHLKHSNSTGKLASSVPEQVAAGAGTGTTVEPATAKAASTRALKPIPQISPSAFTPHLPSSSAQEPEMPSTIETVDSLPGLVKKKRVESLPTEIPSVEEAESDEEEEELFRKPKVVKKTGATRVSNGKETGGQAKHKFKVGSGSKLKAQLVAGSGTPPSSIEQFSSPEKKQKGKGKGRAPPIPLDGGKQKKASRFNPLFRISDEEDDDDEGHSGEGDEEGGEKAKEPSQDTTGDTAFSAEVLRRGAEIAEAAKAKTKVPKKRLPLSTVAAKSKKRKMRLLSLREEEEENTQDLLMEKEEAMRVKSALHNPGGEVDLNDTTRFEGGEAWEDEGDERDDNQEDVVEEEEEVFSQLGDVRDVGDEDEAQLHGLDHEDADFEAADIEMNRSNSQSLHGDIPGLVAIKSTPGDSNDGHDWSREGNPTQTRPVMDLSMGDTASQPLPPQSQAMELPPTASSRVDSAAGDDSQVLDDGPQPAHLSAAMALLSTKSQEISRLEAALAAEIIKNSEMASTIAMLQTGLASAAASKADAPTNMDVQTQTESDPDIASSSTPSITTGEKVAWDLERSAFLSDLEVALKRKVDAERDRDFFRREYERASSYVRATHEENEALEERARLAESQAKNGVQIVRATFEKHINTLEEEKKQLMKMADFIMKKDASVNDEVRRMAGEHPELVRSIEKLQSQLEKAGKVNLSMNTQNDGLRVQLVEVQTEANELRKRLEDLEREEKVPQLIVDDEIKIEDERNESQSRQAVQGELGSDDDVYRCQWRPAGEEMCHDVFMTAKDLRLHFESDGHFPGLS